MAEYFKNLLTPLQIGSVTLKNRMIVAPMGAYHNMMRGPHFEYSDQMIEHITERAKGGFSLFMCSVLKPDYTVDAYDPATSFMTHQGEFKGMALRMNERASFYDMKIFQQLTMGNGRNDVGLYSSSENPYFFAPDKKSPALTVDQIHQKTEALVKGAALMKASGFAGIEVHALHWGYLLDNFAMAITNHRTDEYGGTLENRLRICKEIVEGVKQECGQDYPVTIRLGLKGYFSDFNTPDLTGENEAGRTLEEAVRIAKLLEEYGYDALNCDVGTYDSFYYAAAPQYMEDGYVIPLAAEVKKEVNIPILCGSRMADPYMSDKAIEEGKIDAAVLARPTLADPHYAKKIEMGTPEKIRPCINCLVGCLGNSYSGKVAGCAVNPAARHETLESIFKAPVSRKIAVVGAGVAGMEFARTAKMRGHDVTVYEKAPVAGGLQIPAGNHKFKKHNHMLVEWYLRELEDLGVQVVTNCEMTADKIRELDPDIAVLAVGSEPIMPGLPGIDHPKCSSCVDLLNGKVTAGNSVVIIGGGLVGCETAIDLAMEGKEVTLVEAAEDILPKKSTVPIMVGQMIPDLLKHYKVNVMTGHKIVSISDDGALITPTSGGEDILIPADNVIMSIGMKPVKNFSRELFGSGIETYVIGDGVAAGVVYTAVNGAYDLARRI